MKIFIVIILLAGQCIFAQSEKLYKNPSSESVEYYAQLYNIYNDKSTTEGSDLSGNKHSIQYKKLIPEESLTLSLTRTDLNISTKNPKDQIDFSFASKCDELSFIYERSFQNLGVMADLDIIKKGNSYIADYRTGFSLSTERWYLKKVLVTVSRESRPFHFDFSYPGADVAIDHSLHRTGLSLQYEFMPFPKSILGLCYSKLLPEKSDNSQNRFSMNDLTEMEEWNLKLQSRFENSSLCFNYALYSGRSRLEAFENGQSFSYLHLNDLRYEHISFGYAGKIKDNIFIEAQADHHKAGINITGMAESWPFLDVLKAMILNRIFIQGEINLSVSDIVLNGSFKFGNISIEPAIAYYNVIPVMSAVTWQPVYLVFGQKNVSYNRLYIKRADLGRLNFGIEAGFDKIILGANVSQFIPLFIKKEEQITNEPPEEGESPLVSKNVKADGGRVICFKIKYLF